MLSLSQLGSTMLLFRRAIKASDEEVKYQKSRNKVVNVLLSSKRTYFTSLKPVTKTVLEGFQSC